MTYGTQFTGDKHLFYLFKIPCIVILTEINLYHQEQLHTVNHLSFGTIQHIGDWEYWNV
jgi:hypothetical protein